MVSVHLESGHVDVRDIPPPARPVGFALIRLLCAGICNTDLELQRGYYGFAGTPGHEFVGEVIEADSREWVGRRVAGEINLACGTCATCAAGMGRHCPTRTVLGIIRHPGAFQELFTLPECNLRAVPDSVATEHAVFTEPLAAACEILDQVAIPPGAPVAVLGDGKLGLLIAQTLLAHGCGVVHFGRHAKKLQISERAGARVEVTTALPAAAFDWVVDATGSSSGLDEAIRMTRPRGTVVMKSTVHGPVSFDAAAAIVKEISLVGSRCGRFEPALELLKAGRIDVESMISDRMPLSRAPEAFARANERGALKVLLKP
ncbi:MAG TPA: alcohol dehydrogenase catalytic domain-containing protein [Terracidiphilus sp.]|nr:alcohol dehydrogenase catalytic domain-containing protein [Terracidiphilus sp.]